MKSCLFLFTLGPVQSFIALARKTQDLYAGSQILSRLVRAGIDAFKDEFPDAIVIFPSFDSQRTDASLPNRFVAKIADHEWDDGELTARAQKIRAAVEEEFSIVASESLRRAGIQSPQGFDKQLKAHLDVFWAFQEMQSDFASAYQALESLVGAVKNVRPFTQYDYTGSLGETGRKCSIDGVNNALFYKQTENRRAPAYSTPLETFALNSGEGLSAVSFVKRFYPNTDSFPSTAEVALMHDETRLSEKEKEMLRCYKMLFKKENLIKACLDMFKNGWLEKAKLVEPAKNPEWNDQFDDYQMLYEENLTSKTIPDAMQLGLARNLHTRLKSAFKTKYYALVLFDGDNMGKWLAGDNNQTKDNLEAFHKELSGLLSEFGSQAYQSLNRDFGNGHAVYAGGDDFMGFVNIHYLFDVMKNLREGFHHSVNEKLEGFKQADKHLTFSAGVVIAHYKTPFSEVLKKAREIEKKAKKEGGRNAFGITVLKHSGEVQEAIYKWDTDEHSPDGCANWDALAHIVDELLDNEDGHFSAKFIQNLTTEFYQLTGADLHEIDLMNRDSAFLEEALLCEIERLISRALDKKESPSKDNRRVDELTKKVQNLWKQAPHPKTRNFVHALQITDFITRKTTQS